jgi:DNA-binding CsgD family transcriptional regulator
MVQFEVARKDRKLEMLEKENDIHRLTSSLLWGSVLVLVLVAGAVILFLRRLRLRDKILLATKEELMKALEEQKILKERQLQAELELKESKISALGIQMKQKLMGEVRSRLEKDTVRDPVLSRLLQKGLVKDKEWDDFNTWFEETNVHFYSRLKTMYPGISANDLRICALIKLNFSIKEMAGVLHISPDSVKTARYRLRKKLGMPNEENLSDFILGLG